MPYKSDAQRRYFNANREELEAKGVDVGEWNDSSRGKKLPERAKKKKKKRKKKASDVRLASSSVHGTGLFAKTGFEKDEVVARAAGHMQGEDAQSRYELTKAARYTNHSEDPSAQLVKVGKEVYLVALRDIQPGEEIFVDYSKTAPALGPGSYITYQGHKRANWDELEKQSEDGPMFTWGPGLLKQGQVEEPLGEDSGGPIIDMTEYGTSPPNISALAASRRLSNYDGGPRRDYGANYSDSERTYFDPKHPGMAKKLPAWAAGIKPLPTRKEIWPQGAPAWAPPAYRETGPGDIATPGAHFANDYEGEDYGTTISQPTRYPPIPGLRTPAGRDVESYVHGGGNDVRMNPEWQDPRFRLGESVREQSSRPVTYEPSSPWPERLLQQRHGNRELKNPTQIPLDIGYSGNVNAMGPGFAAPDNPGYGNVWDKIPKNPIRGGGPVSWVPEGIKPYVEAMGREGIKNHEFEHAFEQASLRPSWEQDQPQLDKLQSDVRDRLAQIPYEQQELLEGGNRKLEGEYRDGRRYPDMGYLDTGFPSSYPIPEVEEAYKSLKSQEQVLGNLSNKYERYGHDRRYQIDELAEVGPSIGDLIFRARQFELEEGKPLEHTVKLPGKSLDINWMLDQAKEHGYWGGKDGGPAKSMSDLLFGTPEGRKFYSQMVAAQKQYATDHSGDVSWDDIPEHIRRPKPFSVEDLMKLTPAEEFQKKYLSPDTMRKMNKESAEKQTAFDKIKGMLKQGQQPFRPGTPAADSPAWLSPQLTSASHPDIRPILDPDYDGPVPGSKQWTPAHQQELVKMIAKLRKAGWTPPPTESEYVPFTNEGVPASSPILNQLITDPDANSLRAMNAVLSTLHGQGPRGDLNASMRSQSSKPLEYMSPMGERLYRQRHGDRTLSPMGRELGTGSGWAVKGHSQGNVGQGYVPPSPRPPVESIFDIDPDTGRPWPETSGERWDREGGYWRTMNHESEHAFQQENVRVTRPFRGSQEVHDFEKLHQQNNDILTDEMNPTRVPGPEPWWERERVDGYDRSSPAYDVYEYLKSQDPVSSYFSNYEGVPGTETGETNYDGEPKYSEQRYGGDPDASWFSRYQQYRPQKNINPIILENALTTEVGPSIGDLLFRARQYNMENDKPLEHTAILPGGKEHDINWMLRQGQEKGYWGGKDGEPARSMTDLLFNTTAGQQYYKQMVDGQREFNTWRDKQDPRPKTLATGWAAGYGEPRIDRGPYGRAEYWFFPQNHPGMSTPPGTGSVVQENTWKDWTHADFRKATRGPTPTPNPNFDQARVDKYLNSIPAVREFMNKSKSPEQLLSDLIDQPVDLNKSMDAPTVPAPVPAPPIPPIDIPTKSAAFDKIKGMFKQGQEGEYRGEGALGFQGEEGEYQFATERNRLAGVDTTSLPSNYPGSTMPSVIDRKSLSLADVLPKGYRAGAQQHAKAWRASNPRVEEGYSQDISDKAIDRKVNVVSLRPQGFKKNYSRGATLPVDQVGGYYDPNIHGGQIVLPENPRPDTLGHELTHGTQERSDSFFGEWPPSYRGDIETYFAEAPQPTLRENPARYAKYYGSQRESEAYLATVKRNYYEATGKHVTNAQEAQEALKWNREQPSTRRLDLRDEGLSRDQILGPDGKMGTDDDRTNPDGSPILNANTQPLSPKAKAAKENWMKHWAEKMPGLVRTDSKEGDMPEKQAIDLEAMDPTLRNALLVGGFGATLGGLGGGLASLGGEGRTRANISNEVAEDLLSKDVPYEVVSKLQQGEPLNSTDELALDRAGIDLDEVAPKSSYWGNLASNTIGGAVGLGGLGALVGGGATELGMQFGTPAYIKNQLQTGGGKLPKDFPVIGDIGAALGDAAAKWYRTPAGQHVIQGRLGRILGLKGPTRAEKFELTDEVSDGLVSAPLGAWNKLKGMFKSNAAEKQAAVTEEPHPDLAHLHKSPGWAAAGVGGITGLLGAGAGALGSGALTGSLPAAGIGAGVAGIPLGIMGGMAGYGNQKQLNKDVSRDWVNPELINFDGDMSAPEVFSHPEGELPDDWREQDMAKLNSLGFHGIMPDGGGNYYMKDANGNPVMWFHELNKLYPASDAEYDETYESYADEVQYPLEKQAGDTNRSWWQWLKDQGRSVAEWHYDGMNDRLDRNEAAAWWIMQKAEIVPPGTPQPTKPRQHIGQNRFFHPGRDDFIPGESNDARSRRDHGVSEEVWNETEAPSQQKDWTPHSGVRFKPPVPAPPIKKSLGKGASAVKQALDPMITSGLGMAIPGALAGGILGGVRGAISPGRQPVSKRQAAILRRSGVPEATVVKMESGEDLSDDEETLLNEAGLDIDKTLPQKSRFGQALRSAGKGALIGGGIGGAIGAGIPEYERWRFKDTVREAPHTVRFPQSLGGRDLARVSVDNLRMTIPAARNWPDYSSMSPFQRKQIGKIIGNTWNKSTRADQYAMMKGMPGINFGFESISKLPGRMWDTAFGLEKNNAHKTAGNYTFNRAQLEAPMAKRPSVKQPFGYEMAKHMPWGFGGLTALRAIIAGTPQKVRLDEQRRQGTIAPGLEKSNSDKVKTLDALPAFMKGFELDVQPPKSHEIRGTTSLGNVIPWWKHVLGSENPLKEFRELYSGQRADYQHERELNIRDNASQAQMRREQAELESKRPATSRKTPTLEELSRRPANQPAFMTLSTPQGNPSRKSLLMSGQTKRNAEDKTIVGETAKGLQGFANLISDKVEDADKDKKKKDKEEKQLERAVARNTRERTARRIAKDRDWMNKYDGDAKISGHSDLVAAGLGKLDDPADFGTWMAHRLSDFKKSSASQVSQVPAQSHPLNTGQNAGQMLADVQNAKADPRLAAASRGLPALPASLQQQQQQPGVGLMGNGPLTTGSPLTRHGLKERGGLDTSGTKLGAAPSAPPSTRSKPPATMWGKFTPDQFHKETDVYLKLRDQYKNQPKMLQTMYDSQGYKDWTTAGKAYMNHNKPTATAKPPATAPAPAQRQPVQRQPAQRQPVQPTATAPAQRLPAKHQGDGYLDNALTGAPFGELTDLGEEVRTQMLTEPTITSPKTPSMPMQKANSADLMDQLRSVVAEKEAKGDLPPKKPKYKGAPRSRTTVRPRRKHKDKDDDAGSSTIQYINRRGRPLAK